jgi:hypothetical protein
MCCMQLGEMVLFAAPLPVCVLAEDASLPAKRLARSPQGQDGNFLPPDAITTGSMKAARPLHLPEAVDAGLMQPGRSRPR